MKQKSDLAHVLMVCLGGLWFLDGILQLQPAMFTQTFVSAVLAPNLMGQPSIIANIVAFGIRIFSLNIFWFNLGSALIQLLIGALLIFSRRDDIRRFGLWLSVVWALIVWIFGEGFGNLATGSATFYTGAPGSALLYFILALSLLYEHGEASFKKLPMIAGLIFLVGAALNCAPMFWQSTMLSMLSVVPSISAALGTIHGEGMLIGNILAIDILAGLGIFLMFLPKRPVAWLAILFLVAVWWLAQGFGGILTFPGGIATDPNSAPLLILFVLPIFGESLIA